MSLRGRSYRDGHEDIFKNPKRHWRAVQDEADIRRFYPAFAGRVTGGTIPPTPRIAIMPYDEENPDPYREMVAYLLETM